MRLLFVLPFLAGACGSVSSPPGDADAGPDGPPGTGPKRVTLTTQYNDGTPANIELAAYQDGGGAWQLLTGTDGVYTFMVTGERYAIATACQRTSPLAGTTVVHVRYATVDDGLTRFDTNGCVAGTFTPVAISGTVVNAPANQTSFISSGRSSTTAVSGSWNLSVYGGSGSLVATSLSAAPQRPTSLLLRKVSFAAGSAFNLDFAGGFFPAESALTIDPTAVDPIISTAYLDEDGGSHSIETTTTGTSSYRVVPADRVGNGISTLTLTSVSAGGAFRSIARGFKSPVAQTLTLPAAFVPAAVPAAVTTTPYPIFETALPKRAGAAYYQIRYETRPSRALINAWELTASAAWAEGQAGANVTLRLPDLSALPGWKAGYSPSANPYWNVAVATSPRALVPGAVGIAVGGGDALRIGDGEEISWSSSSGVVP